MMNKNELKNLEVANNLHDEINSLNELFSLGIIRPKDYVQQICIVAQSMKANIVIPNENWAIVRRDNCTIAQELFNDALEAANELNKWENKEIFKIDKI